jgi:hypothetical protein
MKTNGLRGVRWLRFLAGAMLLLACLMVPAEALLSENPRELIVCGWDEVFILDMGQQPPRKVWSWKARDRPELPVEMRSKFRTTDECKPVENGARILITASSDGVALVDRATDKVLFYGSAGGAHSAEMLPGGRIVVASSTSKNPLANSLVLFDVKQSGKPLFVTPLTSGHGVVWDESRQVLWVLAGQYLRSYELVNWTSAQPSLRQFKVFPIPGKSGHDLQPVPGTVFLSVTAMDHAWLFDRDKHIFQDHPDVGSQIDVKSITVNPQTKEIVWTRADEGFWWTDTLRFLNPERTWQMKGERLYKARWIVAP